MMGFDDNNLNSYMEILICKAYFCACPMLLESHDRVLHPVHDGEQQLGGATIKVVREVENTAHFPIFKLKRCLIFKRSTFLKGANFTNGSLNDRIQFYCHG